MVIKIPPNLALLIHFMGMDNRNMKYPRIIHDSFVILIIPIESFTIISMVSPCPGLRVFCGVLVKALHGFGTCRSDQAFATQKAPF